MKIICAYKQKQTKPKYKEEKYIRNAYRWSKSSFSAIIRSIVTLLMD